MRNKIQVKKKNYARERIIAIMGEGLYFDLPIQIYRAVRQIVHRHNIKLLYVAGKGAEICL